MERVRVSVQEGYRRWAPTYDSDPNPLLHLETRHLHGMLPSLQGRRALDLACGSGRWLSILRSAGAASVTGIDFSPSMLKLAQCHTTETTTLIRADCLDLPFYHGLFDLVICSFAVGHILELHRLAKEVKRVSRDQVDVFVSDIHPRAYEAGWKTGFRDAAGSVEIATWPRAVEDVCAPWLSAGFEALDVVHCRFGDEERQVFENGGKADLFEVFSRIPAVLICHFQASGASRIA